MFNSDMRKLYGRFFVLGVLSCVLALLTVIPTTQADGVCQTGCANTYMDCNNWCDDAWGHNSPIQDPDSHSICRMGCNEDYNYCDAGCQNSGPPCYTCQNQHQTCYNGCNSAYNECYYSCSPEDTACQNACASTRDNTCYLNCNNNYSDCSANCSY